MSSYGNYPNPQLCKTYGCHALKNKLNMGCTGCLPTEKELQDLIKSVYDKAKTDAKENKKLHIIYMDSEGKPQYMEAEAAKLAGLRPIQFVSHM